MPYFTIRASEVVYYEEMVEAKNKDDAIDKFYEMATLTLEPVDQDGFQVDNVYEHDDEEDGDD